MVGMSIMVALIRIVVTIDRMRDMVMLMLQVVNVVTFQRTFDSLDAFKTHNVCVFLEMDKQCVSMHDSFLFFESKLCSWGH